MIRCILLPLLLQALLITGYWKEPNMEPSLKPVVRATITAIEQASQNGSPVTHVYYEVINEGPGRVWMNDDGWIHWEQQGPQIRLSLRREPMQRSATPFGYFAPRLAEIKAGKVLRRSVTLGWPLSLSRLWNASDTAAPTPGRYELQLLIGIGYDKSILRSKSVAAADVAQRVLQWQQTIVTNIVNMDIPVY